MTSNLARHDDDADVSKVFATAMTKRSVDLLEKTVSKIEYDQCTLQKRAIGSASDDKRSSEPDKIGMMSLSRDEGLRNNESRMRARISGRVPTPPGRRATTMRVSIMKQN